MEQIVIRKESEKVVAAYYHDFLLLTSNENEPLPLDAQTDDRSDSTLFNPNSNIPHPSSVDFRSCLEDKELNQQLYCQSINA
jgi:hypothetical protein